MQFSKELLKGVADLIVLRALEEGEAYGYQLIKNIRTSSNNIFEFQEGTLYPLLYRLEEKKYVSSEQKIAPNKKMRRYYSVTHKGKKLLRSRTAELNIFMNALRQTFKFT
jgi:PadR family transcriptional regulator PadR